MLTWARVNCIRGADITPLSGRTTDAARPSALLTAACLPACRARFTALGLQDRLCSKGAETKNGRSVAYRHPPATGHAGHAPGAAHWDEAVRCYAARSCTWVLACCRRPFFQLVESSGYLCEAFFAPRCTFAAAHIYATNVSPRMAQLDDALCAGLQGEGANFRCVSAVHRASDAPTRQLAGA